MCVHVCACACEYFHSLLHAIDEILISAHQIAKCKDQQKNYILNSINKHTTHSTQTFTRNKTVIMKNTIKEHLIS